MALPRAAVPLPPDPLPALHCQQTLPLGGVAPAVRARCGRPIADSLNGRGPLAARLWHACGTLVARLWQGRGDGPRAESRLGGSASTRPAAAKRGTERVDQQRQGDGRMSPHTESLPTHTRACPMVPCAGKARGGARRWEAMRMATRAHRMRSTSATTGWSSTVPHPRLERASAAPPCPHQPRPAPATCCTSHVPHHASGLFAGRCHGFVMTQRGSRRLSAVPSEGRVGRRQLDRAFRCELNVA